MTIFSFFTASGFDSQNMDRDEQRYGKKQNGDPNPAIKYDADEQHGTPHHRQHGYLDRQRDSLTAPVIAQVAAENPVLKHPAVHPGIAFRKAVNGQQQKRRGREHRNESPDETEPTARYPAILSSVFFIVVRNGRKIRKIKKMFTFVTLPAAADRIRQVQSPVSQKERVAHRKRLAGSIIR